MEKLPVELQTEILKYNPSFRQTSSIIYNNTYAQHQFVKQHCYTPITTREFEKYLYTYKPNYFIIYSEYEYEFSKAEYYKEGNTYRVINTVLTLDNTDVDEYKFDIRKTRPLYIDLNQILDLDEEIVQYDKDTTFNILKLRNCDTYLPNYSKKYTNSIFNQLTLINKVNYRDDFYLFLKSLLYLNIDINNDDLYNILFNSYGEPYDEDLLANFVNKYS